LPVAGCNNDKKKKKQKTAMMLLDELDTNQQRNCIIAASEIVFRLKELALKFLYVHTRSLMHPMIFL
jgi:hypothetical protein